MAYEQSDPSAASYPINNLRFATPEIQLESTGVGANRSGFRPAATECRFGPGNLNKVRSLRQRASRRVAGKRAADVDTAALPITAQASATVDQGSIPLR